VTEACLYWGNMMPNSYEDRNPTFPLRWDEAQFEGLNGGCLSRSDDDLYLMMANRRRGACLALTNLCIIDYV
jgi:hypothetical protein